MLDFIVIGDFTVDHILKVADPDIINSVDELKYTVTFPFPSKLHLGDKPETHAGGNAYNAATALAKLGLQTGVYSIIGDDANGEGMKRDLVKAGVNCDMVVIDKEGNETNNAFVITIGGDRLILGYHNLRKYELPHLPATKYVYLTSVGEDDVPLFTEILKQKEQQNFQLVFCPGTRQIQEHFTDVKEVMLHTDVLILNKKEAKDLSRLQTESDENLLSGLHRLGPKVVVMTRSHKGSMAYDGKNYYKVGALPVETVETTGAGDSYASTLCAALSMGETLEEAMKWGAINAAHVVMKYGATDGLLDAATLKKELAANTDKLKYVEPITGEAGPIATYHPANPTEQGI